MRIRATENTRWWLALGCVCLICSPLQAEDQLSDEQVAFFEKRIRPVLAERCYTCHSEAAEKLQGGLRLDLRKTLQRGGESGPVIVPGRPDESLLIEAVRHESLEMPPKGKLPGRVIADLVEWVAMGAPDLRIGKLAGNLLPQESVENRAASLTATGFLLLGDVEIVEADRAKLRVDIIDQQVVKTGKAFLGMTIGRARCHDHKFDPIRQRDYYAIAGFFHGTGRDPSADGDLSRDELTRKRDKTASRIGQLNRQIEHAEFFAPSVPCGYGPRDVEQRGNMRITIRGNPRALGDEVPRGFLHVASAVTPVISEVQSGRRQLADWIASPHNPLSTRVAVNCIWQRLFGAGLVRTVDDFGYRPIEGKIDLHDLHATMLHLPGLDHEKLTYRHAGRTIRLTEVFGNVIEDILA